MLTWLGTTISPPSSTPVGGPTDGSPAGIGKPAGLEAALSIRTSYTRPYDDAEGPDGPSGYKYRGVIRPSLQCRTPEGVCT